jgi:hypothetical protein
MDFVVDGKYRMRWQPHAFVRPTSDCQHHHLTRGSEDTARVVSLREDHQQPTMIN